MGTLSSEHAIQLLMCRTAKEAEEDPLIRKMMEEMRKREKMEAEVVVSELTTKDEKVSKVRLSLL